METRNLLIQIALLVLGGIILFKVFQMDANQKIIKQNIEKSLKEIEFAEENLAKALDEITELEREIQRSKAQLELLEKERETIVQNYQDAQEEDRKVINKIKAEIENNNEELERLRNLDEQFEPGAYTTETTLDLRNLIEGASGRLKEYRIQ